MDSGRMHADEVATNPSLVRKLLSAQFPQWAGLAIEPVRSTGTVNAIYRLGDDMVVRLPRVHRWAAALEKEYRWLPRLAPNLHLRVPEPIAKGDRESRYPFSWAIYRWIVGQPFADELIDDERQAAKDLARFVSELRQIDPVAGAPRAGRRPLGELDAITRSAIAAAEHVIDRDAATTAWGRALQAPVWDGTPVWIHTDLLRPNLLVEDGRLCAVIDFGGVGVGDPAADVVAAWSVFGSDGRGTFRRALDVDDGTWNRARGYALHQAAMIIPYYSETNPGFVGLAKRTVDEILAD